MKPNIEGEYLWGEDIVRIARTPDSNWKTVYSATGTAPRLPAFSREYLLELPHDSVGIGQFGGTQLVGYFQPRIVAQGRWEGGILIAQPYTGGLLISGQFVATLREDGGFDVVIEQFDGRDFGRPSLPKSSSPFFTFHPEMERIETVWVR